MSDNSLELLSPGERRRLVIFALLRTVLVAAGLVVIYAFLPMEQWSGPETAVAFVVGLLLVAGLLGFEIRATIRSKHPGLRAVESLGASVPLLILVFATAEFLIDLRAPGSYSEPMTRLSALYLSVTVFATVGFGDIVPVSTLARVVCIVQMVTNLIFLGVVARVLFGAALGRRRSE